MLLSSIALSSPRARVEKVLNKLTGSSAVQVKFKLLVIEIIKESLLLGSWVKGEGDSKAPFEIMHSPIRTNIPAEKEIHKILLPIG